LAAREYGFDVFEITGVRQNCPLVAVVLCLLALGVDLSGVAAEWRAAAALRPDMVAFEALRQLISQVIQLELLPRAELGLEVAADGDERAYYSRMCSKLQRLQRHLLAPWSGESSDNSERFLPMEVLDVAIGTLNDQGAELKVGGVLVLLVAGIAADWVVPHRHILNVKDWQLQGGARVLLASQLCMKCVCSCYKSIQSASTASMQSSIVFCLQVGARMQRPAGRVSVMSWRLGS
jgi:hypothetical protein